MEPRLPENAFNLFLLFMCLIATPIYFLAMPVLLLFEGLGSQPHLSGILRKDKNISDISWEYKCGITSSGSYLDAA